MYRTALIIVALLAIPATAAAEDGVVKLTEPGWPQFRGPSRNGISTETGLLQTWPEDGPKQLWSVDDIGRGYSSAVIAGGKVFITGDTAEELIIYAFDLDGKLLWKVANGENWPRHYPGARGSCTVEGDRLYHINSYGQTNYLSTNTGRELWSVDLLKRFKAPNVQWGIAQCPLLNGDQLIVAPGGPKTLLAALDKRTGETVWTSGPLRFKRTVAFGGKAVDPPKDDKDKAGYASPILFEIGGRRYIAGCSARHLYVADAQTGALLWKEEVTARYEVIGSIPIYYKKSVFFTVPDEHGGCLIKMMPIPDGGATFRKHWTTPVDACNGALVVVDDKLFGSGYRRHDAWVCVDMTTGEMRASKDDITKGTVIYADGRLYALSESGQMMLMQPKGFDFDVVSQFMLTDRPQKDAWSHPSIANGRLYLRYHDRLRCYDIRRP